MSTYISAVSPYRQTGSGAFKPYQVNRYSPPPVPFNDNRPAWATAANDNVPRGNTSVPPWNPRPRYVPSWAFRAAARALPFAGWAMTAYEFWEAVNEWKQGSHSPNPYFNVPNGVTTEQICAYGPMFTVASIQPCTVGGAIGGQINVPPGNWIGEGIAGWFNAFPSNPAYPKLFQQWIYERAPYIDPGGVAYRRFYASHRYSIPNPYPNPVTTPAPAWVPMVDPFAPPQVPGVSPAPRPLPATRPNPNWYPSWRNVPRRDAAARRSASPGGQGTQRGPGPGRKPSYRSGNKNYPREARNQPPQGREKEKKFKMTGATNTRRFLDQMTEWKDILFAAHDALPCHRRRRFNEAKQVYKHYQEIDFELFVKNLIANQIEDFIFGQIGNTSRNLNKRLGQAYGKQANAFRTAWRALDEIEPGKHSAFGDAYDTVAETMSKAWDFAFDHQRNNTCKSKRAYHGI